MPSDVKAAFRELDMMAVEGLAVVLSNPEHIRFEQACEYVIDRNHGKATSILELMGKNGGPIQTEDVSAKVAGMNSEQRAKRRAELMLKASSVAPQGEQETEPDGSSA